MDPVRDRECLSKRAAPVALLAFAGNLNLLDHFVLRFRVGLDVPLVTKLPWSGDFSAVGSAAHIDIETT